MQLSISSQTKVTTKTKTSRDFPLEPNTPKSAPNLFDDDAWFATPDLRAASMKMLLEISIHWQGIILDIAHYETPRRLTFGPDTRADFCYSITSAIDVPISNSHIPLIEASKTGDFLLCFDTEMDGYVEENGEKTKFMDLVKAGRAHSFDPSGLCYYPLHPGAYVELTSQDTIIQIQFVPAPPISVSWFRYLNESAPIVSFSILFHLIMTCFAILSIGPTETPKSLTPTKQELTSSRHQPTDWWRASRKRQIKKSLHPTPTPKILVCPQLSTKK